MSDIHVLEANFKPNGAGYARVVYHVPISVANYPSDDSRTSVVPSINQTELDAIITGTLFEYEENYEFNKEAQSQAQVVSAVRTRWHVIAAKAQAEIEGRYQYYGTTLNRSATP